MLGWVLKNLPYAALAVVLGIVAAAIYYFVSSMYFRYDLRTAEAIAIITAVIVIAIKIVRAKKAL